MKIKRYTLSFKAADVGFREEWNITNWDSHLDPFLQIELRNLSQPQR
jgi:hypothetical protein